ncbi:hypothetical protein LVD15_24580 [Fulvivirga maritima]|uniref:hypothetical protein n=1 Tax=Fulvivirga maritima TaxID=2904247 RepID=UPI001F3C262E|nr:hypothetical protein [Fulvivirga maritima]UII26434.1 hypothetical protein LVD15_24580 [Fulvivirga maritima]
MKIFGILIIYMFLSLASFAQEQDSKPAIKVLARVGEQEISLRWGPTSAVAWSRLNKYGYIVERITVSRDGSLLSVPEKKVLTSVPLKPRPANDWESFIDQNDYAAVAAQAIYGETFELSENYSSDILQVVNKAREFEQRFSFALYAADQSFEAAELSGLAFIDHTAHKNEKYLYRVKSAVPTEIEEIDFGFVYAGLEDYEPLPKIYDLQAIFGDKAVMVSWERKNFDGIYNSFILEKSEDGENYQPVTKQPILNTFEGEEAQSRRTYKLDSLSENDKTFYYRVRGITAFGEKGPASDSVSGSGVTPIYVAPNFIDWSTDNETVDLEWEFSGNNIEGFRIERSRKESGPYQVISKHGSQERTYKDKKPLATNYYRIIAYRGRSVKASFPVLVQLEDSIPPAIPRNIIGKVDSVGAVTLSWGSNQEEDFLGYRVYRSNFKNSEFVQVTKEAVTTNQWSDSINIKTLTPNIYYRVTAVDFRYNESEMSDIIKLKRPDVIPPVPPVFSKVVSDSLGIRLNYIKSSSEDVAKYYLYRKSATNRGWQLVRELERNADSTLVDENLIANKTYSYTMVAVDSSGLESKPAVPVTGSFIQNTVIGTVKNLKATANRAEKNIILTWENFGSADHIKIYRRENDDKLQLYKVISGDQTEFTDSGVRMNNSYEYGIQAVNKNGLSSEISSKNIRY